MQRRCCELKALLLRVFPFSHALDEGLAIVFGGPAQALEGRDAGLRVMVVRGREMAEGRMVTRAGRGGPCAIGSGRTVTVAAAEMQFVLFIVPGP